MAVNAGSRVHASEYNTVAELVNKIFGDNYSSAAVTDTDKTNHRFGWGSTNIDAAVPSSTLITAERLQLLVDRVNVMVDHINVTDSVLVFAAPSGRTSVAANAPVRAEDLNLVESKINNTVLVSNNHITVDPTNASAITAIPNSGGPYVRTDPWSNKITAEHKWSFDDYNHARYFFNSGGQLRVALEMSGGSTTGYFYWSDVLAEMGVLSLTWNNVLQSFSVAQGTSENKGFYDLTQYYGDGSDAGTADEGLLFTSSGFTYSGYGYGYGYSSYSNLQFKIYGKWANNGSEIHLKLVLDDTAFSQTMDGQIEAICSFLMPDNIILNTAEFSVMPEPILDILDNFNSGDDS